MKSSEYGGADTDKTMGIQPAPHVLTAAEQLRVMYAAAPENILAPIPGPEPIDAILE
jgi:hypothetical protein